MTNINVRRQQLVQTQLKKADVKTVDEGKQSDASTGIKLIIKDFQDGKINFAIFEEKLKKLGVNDIKIVYSKDKDGNERAGISFKHDNKTYLLNVPKSHVEPPLEEDPARGAQANTVNTASNVNGGIINEYAEDLKKKLAEYADMKAKWEGQAGTTEQKISLLKDMQNLIRQLFDKHFHFTFTTHSLKQELMNDYVNWNININELRTEVPNEEFTPAPWTNLEKYLENIDPSKQYHGSDIYSEPERLLELRQLAVYYENELDTAIKILDQLADYKRENWFRGIPQDVKSKFLSLPPSKIISPGERLFKVEMVLSGEVSIEEFMNFIPRISAKISHLWARPRNLRISSFCLSGVANPSVKARAFK